LFPRDSSIGCEQRLIKRRSQVRIPHPLPLCGHVKKKKKGIVISTNPLHTRIVIHLKIRQIAIPEGNDKIFQKKIIYFSLKLFFLNVKNKK
jgi:hypothetical protein